MRVDRTTPGFLDDEVVVEKGAARFHSLGGFVPLDAGSLYDLVGEEVDKPLGLDRRGEAHERRTPLAALFDVDGYEELRLGQGMSAFGEQYTAVACACDAVGKRAQDGVM